MFVYKTQRWSSFIKVCTRGDDLWHAWMVYLGGDDALQEILSRIKKLKALNVAVTVTTSEVAAAHVAGAVQVLAAHSVASAAPAALAATEPVAAAAELVAAAEPMAAAAAAAAEPVVAAAAAEEEWESPIANLRRSARAGVANFRTPTELLSRAVRRQKEVDAPDQDSSSESDDEDGSSGDEPAGEEKDEINLDDDDWVSGEVRKAEKKREAHALRLGQKIAKSSSKIPLGRMPSLMNEFRGVLVFIAEIGAYYQHMITCMQTTKRPWIERAYGLMETTLLVFTGVCWDPATDPKPPPPRAPSVPQEQSLKEVLELVYMSNAVAPAEQCILVATKLAELL